MSHPQTIGVSLGAAATPFWFPLADHQSAIAPEHTLFPTQGLATEDILILSPELAWSFAAFPGRSIEIPEPLAAHASASVATVFGPVPYAMPGPERLAPVSVTAAAREFAARANLEPLLDEALDLIHR